MFQRLDVFVEAQGAHGPEEIVPVDRLSLLLLAFVAGFGGDERNEL